MENNLIKYLEEFSDGYLESMIEKNGNVIEDLKTFELFKNVEQINTIKSPVYFGDENGKPLNKLENYLGDDGKSWAVETFILDSINNCKYFNEEIDLFTIKLSDKKYDSSTLKHGVWKYPLQYDSITFMPFEKIVIKYSLMSIEEVKNLSLSEAKKYAKEIILKQVSDLIDADQSNLPHTQSIEIRCSSRSIKKYK